MNRPLAKQLLELALQVEQLEADAIRRKCAIDEYRETKRELQQRLAAAEAEIVNLRLAILRYCGWRECEGPDEAAKAGGCDASNHH